MASVSKKTAAKTSGGAPILSAKAARKKHAAPPGTQGVLDRPSSKTPRKVTFQVDGLEKSSSADELNRRPPTKSEAHRVKKPSPSKSTPADHRAGQRAEGAMFPNPLDIVRSPVAKSVHRRRISRTELLTWSGRFARKHVERSGKHYSRMTIGGTPTSHTLGTSTSGASHENVSKYYVKKGVVVSGLEESDAETSSGDVEEEHLKQHRSTKMKAARKFQVGIKSTPTRPLPPPAVPAGDIEPDGYGEPPDVGAEEITLSDRQSDEPAESESDDAPQSYPSELLLQALENISLPLIRLHKMGRLPFLRRNLQAGFKNRCQLIGIGGEQQALPHRRISVIYSSQSTTPMTQEEDSSFTTRTSITEWLCPLCNIHGAFANQRMLHMHLTWDHPSVEVRWNVDLGELFLTIPQSPPSLSTSSGGRSAHRLPPREPSEASLSSDIPSDVPPTEQIEVSEEPSDRTSITPSTPSVTPTSTFDTKEDIKPKLPPSRATSLSEPSRRSSSASGRPPSHDYSPLHSRSGFAQDVLGPSAIYPFLPDRIGNDVYYSCRPGGPRLYDILNTQSLEPYGVLQWLIVDREEELFELDDIRDEDKVMLALWYRWIFLNRNKFVANYYNGTKSFVKENWHMIRQGAGLLALRAWLLTLCINNFLVPSDVVTLLRFYQQMAGLRST